MRSHTFISRPFQLINRPRRRSTVPKDTSAASHQSVQRVEQPPSGGGGAQDHGCRGARAPQEDGFDPSGRRPGTRRLRRRGRAGPPGWRPRFGSGSRAGRRGCGAAAPGLLGSPVHAHPQLGGAEKSRPPAVLPQAGHDGHVVEGLVAHRLEASRGFPGLPLEQQELAVRHRRAGSRAGRFPISEQASSSAKTAGVMSPSPGPRVSWLPARERASNRPACAAASARASSSGPWRVSASVRSIQGVVTPRAPTQRAWTLPRQPSGRGPASRSSRRVSEAARWATRPPVPSVEPSSMTLTLGRAVCASRLSRQSATLIRSSRTGRSTVTVPAGMLGGRRGREGALRRCSSVLSARPTRPAPRRSERSRMGDTSRAGLGGPYLRAKLLFDLSRLREAAGLLLGEDQLVAGGDLENSARAADQLRLDAERPLEVRRQTGGARVVVSHPAVFDAHVHAGSSFRGDSMTPDPAPGVPKCKDSDQLGTVAQERNEAIRRDVGYYKCLPGAEAGQRKKFPWTFSSGAEYNRDCSSIALPGNPADEASEVVQQGVPVRTLERT